MRLIQVHGKHDDPVFLADTQEQAQEAALKIVEMHNNMGYYYNWDDEGNPETQWEDRAKQILETKDGAKALELIDERSDHEYEYTEFIYTN